MNIGLVQWFSQKQSTVELSVFGAEFVVMKQGIDALKGLRYKLRMIGISTSDPSNIHEENMSVVSNTSRPESVLRKKSILVCHHVICESVAVGESLVLNVTDLIRRVLHGHRQKHLVSNILYDIHDNH